MQPVYQINEFLLYNSNSNLSELMSFDGTGVRPIYPVQQTPESNLDGRPFLTYTVRTTTFPTFWWRHIEDVAYTVWSTSIDASQEVANEMIDVLRRMDDSAEELNDYCHREGYDDYRFHYIRLLSTMSPTPVDAENDRYGMPLTFRYEYSQNKGRGLA